MIDADADDITEETPRIINGRKIIKLLEERSALELQENSAH